MANEYFFPPLTPHASGMLKVGGAHTTYWEACGNPEGIPILFVHGGPGAGCSEFDRRFFDPARFRVILVDQRGCGRSRPLGELTDNTIDELVADFERVRELQGIDRWHVFGGSWGSTLSLYYAQQRPERVHSLVLRGIWLLRERELQWWFQDLGWLMPELWQRFVEHLPEDERGDLLESYWRRLTGPDHDVAMAAARAWSTYEGSVCTLLPNPEFADMFAQDDLAWCMARLEAHYMRNQRFQPDTLLLDRVPRLRHIPAFAVHGRYDVVCPVKNLTDLAATWPELDWEIVPDAGHSSHESGITRALVGATNRIAATGSPVRS